MDYETLQDLYLHELKDLHSVEKQIIRAIPKMIKHATSPQLKKALEEHLKETEKQVERLDQIFERSGKSTRGVKCKGIEGILEEAEAWLSENASPEVMDAGIISVTQRVEHYEIAGYGCVRTYANLLGKKEDEQLLDQTLQEEGKADKALTSLAEKINLQARQPQHA